MTYMACPNIDECHSSDFKLAEDGRIVCADDDCGRTFGRWSAGLADAYRPPAGTDDRDCYDTGWSDALTWGWEKLARDAGWTPAEGTRP